MQSLFVKLLSLTICLTAAVAQDNRQIDHLIPSEGLFDDLPGGIARLLIESKEHLIPGFQGDYLLTYMAFPPNKMSPLCYYARKTSEENGAVRFILARNKLTPKGGLERVESEISKDLYDSLKSIWSGLLLDVRYPSDGPFEYAREPLFEYLTCQMYEGKPKLHGKIPPRDNILKDGRLKIFFEVISEVRIIIFEKSEERRRLAVESIHRMARNFATSDG